jgi:C-terminal processing protease CtpA/Prc
VTAGFRVALATAVGCGAAEIAATPLELEAVLEAKGIHVVEAVPDDRAKRVKGEAWSEWVMKVKRSGKASEAVPGDRAKRMKGVAWSEWVMKVKRSGEASEAVPGDRAKRMKGVAWSEWVMTVKRSGEASEAVADATSEESEQNRVRWVDEWRGRERREWGEERKDERMTWTNKGTYG